MTEQDLARPDFNPGGLPYYEKPTDFKWENIGAALPPFEWGMGYDIEAVLGSLLSKPGFLLPVKDQDGSGSCGGQADSSEDAVLEAVATKTHEERSAKYIIAQTFITNPVTGAMLGSNMGANGDILRKQGVSRELVCLSYDNGQPPKDAFMNRPQDITEAARADAKISKARSYSYVATDIDAFAQAIAANYGLVMLLGAQNNGTWFSPFPKPPTVRQWGHFMYCGKAKIINGKKYIGALQSWGKNVGENGWQWFGEDYFQSGFIEAGQTFVFDDTALSPAHYTFTRDLTLGAQGVDVRFLQIFLNTHGAPVASSGPGSPGHESSFFGELTRLAVVKFQRDQGIKPALGYFGPITRARVNGMV